MLHRRQTTFECKNLGMNAKYEVSIANLLKFMEKVEVDNKRRGQIQF